MDILDVVLLIIDSGAIFDKTNDVSSMASSIAESRKWYARTEYPAPYTGKTGFRNGRIDLFLSHDGSSAGVEVDNKTIKRKSVEKLLSLDLKYRVAVVANGSLPNIPHGIDAVVSLKSMDYKIARR